jgi:hypothetical protein
MCNALSFVPAVRLPIAVAIEYCEFGAYRVGGSPELAGRKCDRGGSVMQQCVVRVVARAGVNSPKGKWESRERIEGK